MRFLSWLLSALGESLQAQALCARLTDMYDHVVPCFPPHYNVFQVSDDELRRCGFLSNRLCCALSWGGACFGFAAAAHLHDPVSGLIIGALAGAVLSCLHGVLCIHLKVNQIASGLCVMMLGMIDAPRPTRPPITLAMAWTPGSPLGVLG